MSTRRGMQDFYQYAWLYEELAAANNNPRHLLHMFEGYIDGTHGEDHEPYSRGSARAESYYRGFARARLDKAGTAPQCEGRHEAHGQCLLTPDHGDDHMFATWIDLREET